MNGRASWPWRVLSVIGTWGVALLVLFEEWGWIPLARAVAWLGRCPLVARLERLVAGLPAKGALLVFLVPALMLLPVKLGAVWLLARGRWIFGALLLLSAKVLGTAVVARIFQLTRPSLMSLPGFARRYLSWQVWKEAALARVRRSRPWRMARVWKWRARTVARPPR